MRRPELCLKPSSKPPLLNSAPKKLVKTWKASSSSRLSLHDDSCRSRCASAARIIVDQINDYINPSLGLVWYKDFCGFCVCLEDRALRIHASCAHASDVYPFGSGSRDVDAVL